LAAFLKLVESGRVPKGSFLIIENLDRLTREDERAALRLWMDLLDAGVNIVQLKPETLFRHEKSDMFDIMRAVMELSRGHGESTRKQELNGKAWQEKLRQARAQEPQAKATRKAGREIHVVTTQLPAWVELKAGKPVLIPARAAVVKHIFTLAAAGYGMASIVKRLTEEGVPAFGDRESYTDDQGRARQRAVGGRYGSGVWVRGYIAKVLKDRRAVGEHQPRGQGRKPDGPPIKGYFPAVVTEEEWLAARDGAAQRKTRRGRVAKHVNVFAGLLRNARNKDDTFFVSTQAQSKGGRRVLVSNAGCEGRGPHESFPADVFEWGIFSLLREIDPHDILNGDQGPDESAVLAARLVQVETSIAVLMEDMEANGESAALLKRVRDKEAEQRGLAEKLVEARQKALHPLSASWGEAQSLMAALDAAPDPEDTRLRLRACLRRMIDSVHLLIVPRGLARLAAVQVFFRNGRRRDYLLFTEQAHQVGKVRTERRQMAWSLADVVPADDDLDLRRSKDALALARGLEQLDLDALVE
jgi:hypothetical protein